MTGRELFAFPLASWTPPCLGPGDRVACGMNWPLLPRSQEIFQLAVPAPWEGPKGHALPSPRTFPRPWHQALSLALWQRQEAVGILVIP